MAKINQGYVYDIHSPMWLGREGEESIGIAEWRAKKYGLLHVHVTYKNANGDKPFPGCYIVKGNDVMFSQQKQKLSECIVLGILKIKDLPDMSKEGKCPLKKGNKTYRD